MRSAEIFCIKSVQEGVFTNELKSLREHICIDWESRHKNLSTFLDENGIMRVGGRLQNLSAPLRTIHLVLMPDNHRFSELIYLDAHRPVMHGGVSDTLVQLRDRFRFLRARRMVK